MCELCGAVHIPKSGGFPHPKKSILDHRDLAEAVMDDIDKLLNEFISKNNYRASMFFIVKNK